MGLPAYVHARAVGCEVSVWRQITANGRPTAARGSSRGSGVSSLLKMGAAIR